MLLTAIDFSDTTGTIQRRQGLGGMLNYYHRAA
jgi:hypothetical protein